MTYHIDIQNAALMQIPVDNQTITDWANLALASEIQAAELTIRFVDIEEITFLNNNYRKKNKPTNVLAFPANLPNNIELECPLLGDVIICPEILQNESIVLNKTITSHYALLVIHGTLHLLGYDHIEDEDAIKMQALEISLLAKLGFENPYLEDENEI
ncbi:MAG: rRNA maturation RNase YbeY [Legionellaceae bacterium]|nr:rRNA maturation RNase YbeY [Legionellaceae bacterium]